MSANPKTLSSYQSEIHSWSTRNFGHNINICFDTSAFLGMVEEIGEIAHAILKLSQGIRGDQSTHVAAIKDGVADLLIFTLDFCARNNLDAESLLSEVWAKVSRRDWKRNPVTGGDLDAGKESSK